MNKEQLEKACETSHKIELAKQSIEKIKNAITKHQKHEALTAIDPMYRDARGEVRVGILGDCSDYQFKAPIVPMLEMELEYHKGELKKLEAQFNKM